MGRWGHRQPWPLPPLPFQMPAPPPKKKSEPRYTELTDLNLRLYVFCVLCNQLSHLLTLPGRPRAL